MEHLEPIELPLPENPSDDYLWELSLKFKELLISYESLYFGNFCLNKPFTLEEYRDRLYLDTDYLDIIKLIAAIRIYRNHREKRTDN